MMLLRRLGYALIGLVAQSAVGLAALYAITTHDLLKTYSFPDASVPAATDSSGLERGQHLVEVIGKCAVCHGDDYGGKVLVNDFAMGHLVSANLTSGGGGIGDYTDGDYERAIRHGVGRDGRALIFMPAEAYNVLRDIDLAAMIGYLRRLPPVDREAAPSRVGPMARALYIAVGLPLLPVKLIDQRRASGAGARAHGGIRALPRHGGSLPQLSWFRLGRRRRAGSARPDPQAVGCLDRGGFLPGAASGPTPGRKRDRSGENALAPLGKNDRR